MTGTDFRSIRTYISIDKKNSYRQEVLFSFGITDKIDLAMSALFKSSSEASFILKYDVFQKNTIAAIKFNDVYFSPQFHWVKEGLHATFQGSIVGHMDYRDIKRGSAYGTISPGLFLNDGLLHVFCSVSPGYYRQNSEYINSYQRDRGFDIDIVPGTNFYIGKLSLSFCSPIYEINEKPVIGFSCSISNE